MKGAYRGPRRRRARDAGLREVVYSAEQHLEFLSGFSKRKKLRKAQGQRQLAAKAREDKIEERRQQRELALTRRKLVDEEHERAVGEAREGKNDDAAEYDGDEAVERRVYACGKDLGFVSTVVAPLDDEPAFDRCLISEKRKTTSQRSEQAVASMSRKLQIKKQIQSRSPQSALKHARFSKRTRR
mmetsp:Transcript_297/g.775  ORF Transcript_297/g.775 Transcript_297/m.775 type:complete len:185 (+) Transcript_297:22-576(+)